jgi:pimeloyl-ACP methyl ester carboxylesterase
MTPFYFGSAERRLFGVYDPARKSGGATRAVVLCNPSGDEQIHAYRTLRQLANLTSRVGMHVLRFDYYGTGDSSGETGAGDIASWCSDIETAIAELKDMTGATKVTLVGLRLGASMAAWVAAKRPDEVDSLILWEPLTVDEHARADCEAGDNSHHIDLSPLTDSLPSRTLVVLTARAPRSSEFGNLSVTQLASVSPWTEERVITGTIPLDVLHRIVNWLR